MPDEAIVRTPFGRDLYVACDADGIVASRFVARRPAAIARARRSPLLRDAVAALEAYFARRFAPIALPLSLTGTDLQLAVWRAVADLPPGAVVSYSDVARAIGRPRSARGVANALSKTPLAIFIPAHRVVGADGRVRGAAANSLRRRLLAFERPPEPATR